MGDGAFKVLLGNLDACRRVDKGTRGQPATSGASAQSPRLARTERGDLLDDVGLDSRHDVELEDDRSPLDPDQEQIDGPRCQRLQSRG